MEKSLKQHAYSIIRSKILTCEYAPNTFLNEDLLCKEINVSRTPIRDALSRLEQENLVKIIPKKGVVVAPLTVNEVNIIYETRILLEPYIIATYGCKINEELQNKMHNILSQADINMDNMQKIYDLDDEYHRIIVELCENKYLIQCYDNIYAQNLRLRIISGNQNTERMIATHEEHMLISNQILKRDYKKASEAMVDHLIASKDAAFKALLDGNCPI
jgi:DNA-binding GntR family transcriptional regulator